MENFNADIASTGYPLFAVECEPFVPNRYALVLAAAARARQLNRGDPPRIEAGKMKAPHLALSEIAAGAFSRTELNHLLGLDRAADATAAIEIDRPDSDHPDEEQLLDGITRQLAARPSPPNERLDTWS